ncbi:MAG: hypothetical protein LBO76_07600 [Treponema sp.]|jgi:hypothetical protein|nr:hypothetical protein [Treponema sp.]
MGRRRGAKGALYLAVLVPHRDSRKILREWSAELFASGLWGAWSFPQVSPLAWLSSPLAGAELKDLARRLRELTLAGGRDGTLRLGADAVLPLPGLPVSLYGPRLDIALGPGDLPGEKIREIFPAPLVGCAALGPDDPREILPPRRRGGDFRAAAVANMAYRPIGAGSYAWRIGEPRWLPRARKPGGTGERP